MTLTKAGLGEDRTPCPLKVLLDRVFGRRGLPLIWRWGLPLRGRGGDGYRPATEEISSRCKSVIDAKEELS